MTSLSRDCAVIVRDLVLACRALAAAGQTIVLVEQNIAAALALSHRVYILNNGHVVHEGPASELREGFRRSCIAISGCKLSRRAQRDLR